MQKLTPVTFSQGENKRLFDEYLKIKYDVFVEEMHWNRIPHVKTNRMALPDSHDKESKFCAAVDEGERLVAVARGTLPKRLADMYRVQWYADFSTLDFVQALDGKIATINAVAVRQEYRWGYHGGARRQTGVSDLLMKNMVSELEVMGAEVILLTAVAGPAYSLMRRIGFKTINSPHALLAQDYSTMADAPTLMLFDMAIMTRDFRSAELARATNSNPGLGESSEICRLRTYLGQVDESYHLQN